MFYKKIQKNSDNTIGFQKTLNFNGVNTVSGDQLLFTFADLEDTSKPYGNLFKSFNLPITSVEQNEFNIKYAETAFSNLSVSKIVVVEIPKGEYGELIDGKTFKLDIPAVISGSPKITSLYGSYFNWNSNINKQLSDKNIFSNQFGTTPSSDNDNNSNVTYLFCNDIKKPVGSISITNIYNQATPDITGRTSFVLTSFTVNSGETYSIISQDPSESLDIRIGLTPYSTLKYGENKIVIPPNVSSENISFYNTSNRIVKSFIVKIDQFTSVTGTWDQYTSSNKFPTTTKFGVGKSSAIFSGQEISYNGGTFLYPEYDQPVGILFQDKGIAVITDQTLVNSFIYSAGTSTGYNNITSGNTYSGDTNFAKIYFSSSATTNFNSITTEYVQNVTCLAMPNEFTTTNNSTYKDAYDENTFEKPVFITSIGLYNKFGELVGIGKFSEPIKKTQMGIVPFTIKLKI